MSSTAVLNKPSYKVKPSPAYKSTGATQYATTIARGYSAIYKYSTIVAPSDELSLINKTEIQRIKELARLEENWDSDGAAKINDEAIAKAINFIENINAYNVDVYFSSPGPNGEVMVQLKNKASEIEFIFYPYKAKFVQFRQNQFITQGDYKLENLKALLDWLSE